MRIPLTPGALRALHRATNYLPDTSPSRPIDAVALLQALVEEPECRAAQWLEESGITAASLRQKLDELREPVADDVPLAGEERHEPSPAAAYPDPNQVEAPRFFLDDQPARAPRLSPPLREALTSVHRQTTSFGSEIPLATEHFLWMLSLLSGPVGKWLRQRECDPMAVRDRLNRQYPEFALPAYSDDDRHAIPIPMPEEPVAPPEPDAGQVEIEPPVALPTNPTSLFRIFDAVSNRAAEAIRVLEDHCRFVLDDRHLTEALKGMRHEIRETTAALPVEERLHARETRRDWGTALEGAREYRRADAGEVMVANFLRLQESLRSLEEYAKTLLPEAARDLEQLRYRSYTLQKAMLGTHHSLHRFEGARLYVLIDVERSADVFGRKVDALVAAGVDFLQLRDKSADDRTLLERAGRLRDATRGTPTRFIMNDRPDLAVLADADGVHLGQEELSVHQARQLIGPRRLIGYSTHSLDQATQAVLDGADYIGVGPTFRSTTKSFETFPGLDLLAQVARAIRLPAFAIGGIDTDRLDAVLETGIHGVAVASAIWSADDVEQAAKAFLSRLRRPSRNSDLPAGEA